MNYRLCWLAALISLVSFSCSKESTTDQETASVIDAKAGKTNNPQPGENVSITQIDEETDPASSATATSFVTYRIRRGQHYSDLRPFKSVSVTEMRFFAKFDQSAIYQTVSPDNQYDINKLWGFSEGLNNQYNSARIGWGYSNGAIRLYGYVYSRGARYYQEITTALPGQELNCSIRISGSTYICSVNGVSVSLPRGATGSRASGLQQYPYFGGDEVAPQDIFIFIKPA